MDEPPETLETDETFDPSRRKLCPDGACVGVIGDDGLCRVCGRTEAQAAAGDDAPGVANSDFGTSGEESGEGSAGAVPGDPTPGDGFDPSRRLCDDGSCVGVVGPDGVCAVCGRRAE